MSAIILGSGSPRRAAILKAMGIAFKSCPVNIDETQLPNEPPLAYVRRLAECKARTAHERHSGEGEIYVGADTIVILNNEVLGKPRNAAHAVRTLQTLSGETHQVITAVGLVTDNARAVLFHAVTDVTFNALSQAQIEAYVDTGSPLDKAGAYGIQDTGGTFVKVLDGSFSNVVGLPVERLVANLAQLDFFKSDEAARLAIIRGRMGSAITDGRPKPTLVGASKGQRDSVVKAMYQLGLTDFGESYVQEWERKRHELKIEANWHFMGRIQTNKLRKIVEGAALIHTLTSEKQCSHIQRHATGLGRIVPCLIQVNVGGEDSKGGIQPEQLGTILNAARRYDALRIDGLMTLPPPGEFAETRKWFGQLHALGQEFFESKAPILSMGMSGDLEVAISEGSTTVRVGTALFGPRV